MDKTLAQIFKIHGKEIPLTEFVQYIDVKARFQLDRVSIPVPTTPETIYQYQLMLMEGYIVDSTRDGKISLTRINIGGILSSYCVQMWEEYRNYVKLRLNTELGRRLACEKLKDVDEAILRLERVFLNDPDYVRLLELRNEQKELKKIISEPVK